MDRTKADKIESNIVALKNELDNYYMGRDGSQQAIKDLSTRIFEIVHGFDATAAPDLLAACEAIIAAEDGTAMYHPDFFAAVGKAKTAIAAARPTEPVE